MAIFGGKSDASSKPLVSRPDTEPPGRASRLGRELFFDGTLSGSEPLAVEGEVHGRIDVAAELRIGQSARVQATIHARTVVVEGTIRGDLSADQRVELVSTANVEGNIRAPKIVVAEGARFQGSIDMNATRPDERASAPDRKGSEEPTHGNSRKQA